MTNPESHEFVYPPCDKSQELTSRILRTLFVRISGAYAELRDLRELCPILLEANDDGSITCTTAIRHRMLGGVTLRVMQELGQYGVFSGARYSMHEVSENGTGISTIANYCQPPGSVLPFLVLSEPPIPPLPIDLQRLITLSKIVDEGEFNRPEGIITLNPGPF